MSMLTGKRTVVTGGGSGIGLGVARLFLQEGARVAIVGRTETRLRRAVNELGGGDRLLAQLADVSDSLQVDTFVQRITDLWGGIDVLVNNAGTNIKERTIRELNPKRWQVLMRLQPGRDVQLHPCCVAADAPTQGWGHRQHLFRGWATCGTAGGSRLRRGQAWSPCPGDLPGR